MQEPESDPLQRASVSLLIHGDDLVPEELSAILGVRPKIGVRKGESFPSTGLPGRVVTASTGKWIFSTGYRNPPNIDQQVTDLLASLPTSADIWADLNAKYDVYLTVGVYFSDDSWTGGFLLHPSTLRMLGERGLTVDFDMYAPAASD